MVGGHAAVIHRPGLVHQHEITDPLMRWQLGIESLTSLFQVVGDPRRDLPVQCHAQSFMPRLMISFMISEVPAKMR
ncbi:hypothetical protein FBY03_11320 [Pseudomonas sp. SJZ079]|nr:hypothetical protein FBY03_11320 [Pseudomonas sp. SJZ079]